MIWYGNVLFGIIEYTMPARPTFQSQDYHYDSFIIPDMNTHNSVI